MASGGKPDDASTGSTAAASAAAFLDEAREKLKTSDTAGALICLRAVSGLAGCPPDVRMEACKLLAQTGDSAGAIECYMQAGQSYLTDQKDHHRARQAFQAAHALDTHNLDVIFMLGQSDVAEGRMQDGLAKFIDVLRKSNLKHVPALFEAGCIYQSNGQFDQAMLAFKKVLDRDKNHVKASLHIGQLYQTKDNLKEAIAHYIQAAQIAYECQHWSSARQIASMVLALDADNQKARLILADLDDRGLGSDEAAEAATQAALAAARQAAAQEAAAKQAELEAAARAAVSAKLMQPAATANAPGKQSAEASTVARPAAPAPAQAKYTPVQRPPSAPSAAPARPAAAPAAPAASSAPPPERPLAPQVAAKVTPARAEPPAAAPQPAAPAAAQPATVQGAGAPSSDEDAARARHMLAAIEMQRQAAQADLQMLLSSREELQKALAEQRTILDTATMRKQTLEAQIAAATEQAAQATQAAKAAAAAAAAAAQPSEADKSAVAALAAQRRELEAAVEQLHADLALGIKEKDAAQQTVADMASQRDKIAQEVAALTGKLQDAKKLVDELEAMRETAGSAQAAATGKAEALGAKVAELETRRAELEAHRFELETRRTELDARRAALEARCNELEARAAKLEKEASGSEAAVRERTAAARQAAEEAEVQRVQRQAEVESLAQKVEALRASLAEMERRSAAPPPPPVAAHPNVGPQGAHARAAAHLAAGEYEKAIEAYRQSLDANPQDAAAAYQAGALLAEGGGDLSIAEELLTRAAELRPEHAATKYQLAVVRSRRGKVVEGVEILTNLVRADSNNGEFIDQFIERMEKDAEKGNLNARFKLGVAYRELGRVEEALVTLQAIQHEKEYVVPCLIAIGLCLRRQGLDGAAAKRFAKAVETPGYAEPLYLEALYNLGDLYEAKGTQESLALALSSFEEVYARDCTYRDVGERVRVVKTNLGSAERLKVKRLPTRMADSQGNQ